MDFDSAINAHVQWKMKLSNYLSKPDQSLNPVRVSSDQNCELGKWLYGEGKKHSNLAGFSTLLDAHAKFHRVAGDVIRRANAGENVAKEIALGASSEFAKVSNAVVSDLRQLRSLVRSAETKAR
jgi:methyl-accepting chemotaxis protein